MRVQNRFIYLKARFTKLLVTGRKKTCVSITIIFHVSFFLVFHEI